MQKKYEGNKIKGKILISAIISVVLIISIAVFTKKFLDEFIETQNSIVKLINISGKQRMLTQKIMLLVQSIQAQKNPESVSIIKNDLLNSIQDMKNSNEILMYGSIKENILKITNNEIERMFNNKLNLYKRIKEYTSLAEESAKKNDYNEFLIEFNLYKMNSLLADLEKLSKLYTNENELQSRKINALSFIIIFGYFVLSIIIIFFIFKPLGTKISNSYVKLEKEFHNKIIQNKVLEIETKIAQKTFSQLAPRVEYLEAFNTEGISLAAFSQSAKENSKDWWGIYEFDKTKVVLIGDVIGHDNATDIVIKSISNYFENVAKQKAADKTNFLDVFKHLNSTIQELGTTNQLELTMSILIFNETLNRIKFINAGHNFPYLIEYKEKDEIKISRFKAKGHSLGIKKSAASETQEEIKIAEYEYNNGSMLFLFTNGIIINKDKFDKEFSEKNLKKIFEKNNFNKVSSLTALEKIIFEAYQYYDKKPISEDITCIVIKRN